MVYITPLVINALWSGHIDINTGTDTQSHRHTQTHTRTHTHTHTHQHANQNNFKKPGASQPVVGARLV